MISLLKFDTNSNISFSVNSPDFKNGVNALAKILNVTPHPDHKITLEAIRKIVCTRLNTEALENPNSIIHRVNILNLACVYYFTLYILFLGNSFSLPRC